MGLIALYLAAIVAANLSVAYFGPASTIVNAFLFIGLDLTARDRLHDAWHGRGLAWKMTLLIIRPEYIELEVSAANRTSPKTSARVSCRPKMAIMFGQTFHQIACSETSIFPSNKMTLLSGTARGGRCGTSALARDWLEEAELNQQPTIRMSLP
jgi:hypothetical protein